MAARTLTFRTVLAAPAAAVWVHATSIAGINDELRPVLRMTAPRSVSALDPAQIVLGERLFRSWLLLLGLVPVDWDDLTVVELEPGHRFKERSRMLSSRVWQHERVVDDVRGGGCSVTDRIDFVPRIRLTGSLLALFVTTLFRHRHRRLLRRFG